MTTQTQAVATTQAKFVEFVPFGAADKIKLSVQIVQNIVAVPTKSGKTCNDRDAMKFIMLCQAQRLNPFAGDAFLVGYDSQNGPSFSLITAHQAFLKRAESSPEFDGMLSGIIILDEQQGIIEREGDFHMREEVIVGGWAKVFHKKHAHPTYRRIRLERFNSGFAQWKADPAGMIVKCAEADALRSTFPTLLGGLYTEEERIIEVETAPAKPGGVPSKPGKKQASSFIDAGEAVRAAEQSKAPETTDGAATAVGATGAYTPAEPDPLLNVDKPHDSLLAMAQRDGVSEDQVIVFAKEQKLAGPKVPEIMGLSTANALKLAQAWPTAVVEIRKVQI